MITFYLQVPKGQVREGLDFLGLDQLSGIRKQFGLFLGHPLRK